MSVTPPKLMEAQAAARALQTSLKDSVGLANGTPKPVTIADAAAASGLPLRDAELGLHALTSEYRGHLRVTEDGDLLFLFPTGFTKPWETKDAIDAALAKLGRGAMGVARFVVRAWLLIAILGYALAFVAILIALTVAQNSGDSNNSRRGSSGGGAIGMILFRLLADSLFWTFHPFSPFAYGYGGYGAYGYDRYDRQAFRPQRSTPKDETPFYEKVNRFVFGPTPPPDEPRAAERAILSEIRAQKGRIGLADVMRVTGLPRDEADPLMARLMLDYDGDVEVSEEGGITYKFAEIRKTADDPSLFVDAHPPAIWSKMEKLPPLTGNSEGSNFLIGLLNLFNLGMGWFSIENNLTIARLVQMFTAHPRRGMPFIPIPYDGVPIALGVVPLFFSAAIFLFPIVRSLLRSRRAREVAEENGRRTLLREILTRIAAHEPIPAKSLEDAWTKGAGSPPDSKALTRRIVELGGDAEILESGDVRYRFVDLETEEVALEEERHAAQENEARVGRVIFTSEN